MQEPSQGPQWAELVLGSSGWAGLSSHTEEMQLVPGTLLMTPKRQLAVTIS